MCLIALSSATGDFLNSREMAQASDTNPVGFGLMWLDGGRVHTYRTMDKAIADYPLPWIETKMTMGTVFAAHWRFATVGKVNEANCHPFPILSRDLGDDTDLYMMFNGTLSQYAVSEEWSDTAVWAEVLRGRLLTTGDPYGQVSYRYSDFWTQVEEEVGHNTALFLSPLCGFKSVPDLSFWHMTQEGVACSNEYSIYDPYYRTRQAAAKEAKENALVLVENKRWVKNEAGDWTYEEYDEESYRELFDKEEQERTLAVDRYMDGTEDVDVDNEPSSAYGYGLYGSGQYVKVSRRRPRRVNDTPYLSDTYYDGLSGTSYGEDADILMRDFSNTLKGE